MMRSDSIAIANISDPPFLLRPFIRTPDFDELKKSIQEHGLMAPVLVRSLNDGKYELISGRRRLTAAEELGWERIDARVCDDFDEITAIAMQFHASEDRFRADDPVGSLTRARARALQLKPDMTWAEFARLVGRSESYVRGHLGK
jgi:ParB family chromosome partitioning protein